MGERGFSLVSPGLGLRLRSLSLLPGVLNKFLVLLGNTLGGVSSSLGGFDEVLSLLRARLHRLQLPPHNIYSLIRGIQLTTHLHGLVAEYEKGEHPQSECGPKLVSNPPGLLRHPLGLSLHPYSLLGNSLGLFGKFFNGFVLLTISLIFCCLGVGSFCFGMGRFDDRRQGGWSLLGLAALLLSLAGVSFRLSIRFFGFH